MLTDIFAARYAAIPIWRQFGEPERRLLVQAFQIVKDQLFPFWTNDGKERNGAKEAWTSIHDRLKVELGLRELSALGYFDKVLLYGTERAVWKPLAIPHVCETFVCAQPSPQVSPDVFIKERLSFIEIAFRDKEIEIAKLNAALPSQIARAEAEAKRPHPGGHFVFPGNPADGLRALNRQHNDAFDRATHELNERLRQADTHLNYHNGFIQISDDQQILTQIETPFWNLVKDQKWMNVDADMKEAVDRRDSGGRDPAFYAAKALESAIKIISEEKGWTRGTERGAHNYIDNLASSRNGAFISRWEQTVLKNFFSDIRNELGHGPGGAPIPILTVQQTDWALEFCMSWIKSLILRL